VGIDLAVTALTAQRDGPGRYLVRADLVAASSSPTAVFEINGLTSFTGDGVDAKRCAAGAVTDGWATITCAYPGPVDGRTSLSVTVSGRTLEARVRVSDPAADDPRPSNNVARVAIS
jgi:hypothetical protein